MSKRRDRKLTKQDEADVRRRQKAQTKEASEEVAKNARRRELGFEVLGIAPELVDRSTPTVEE